MFPTIKIVIVKMKLNYDRQSVGVRHPSGTRDQFFFLLEIFFRQLQVCYFVAPSLTRVRVCKLLLLLVSSAQSRSGLSPAGLNTIFYCSNPWHSHNLQGQVPVFISARNRVAQIYPRALGSLSCRLYRLAGLEWRFSVPPSHGKIVILYPLLYTCVWRHRFSFHK
jgi:hypothetical protein